MGIIKMAKTYTFYSSNWWAQIEFELEERQDWDYRYWELSRWDYSHIFKTKLEAESYILGYMACLEEYSCDERH